MERLYHDVENTVPSNTVTISKELLICSHLQGVCADSIDKWNNSFSYALWARIHLDNREGEVKQTKTVQ